MDSLNSVIYISKVIFNAPAMAMAMHVDVDGIKTLFWLSKMHLKPDLVAWPHCIAPFDWLIDSNASIIESIKYFYIEWWKWQRVCVCLQVMATISSDCRSPISVTVCVCHILFWSFFFHRLRRRPICSGFVGSSMCL